MCYRVQGFCCGCTLRHGAITAAILTWIAAIAMIGYGLTVITLVDKVVDIHEQQLDRQFNQMSGRMDSSHNQNAKETQDMMRSYGKIAGYVLLVMGLLALAIAICLTIGICKNMSGFVLPWLVGSMVNIVVSCALIILMLIGGAFFALTGLIGLAFNIYMWIVLYSYYHDLRTPRYTPPPTKA